MSLGCQAIVATAGRASLGTLPPGVFAADYLPGDLAARRAAVVISNGGSTTGYQALAEGRPVLGVPYNLDQYLASQAIVRSGAGLSVRAGLADAKTVAAALSRLLAEPTFTQQARALSADLRGSSGPAAFAALVERKWPTSVAAAPVEFAPAAGSPGHAPR